MINIEPSCFERSAYEIAKRSNAKCPDKSTDDIKQQKCTVMHLAYTSNNRCKCTDKWNEASNNDRFSAVFFVEILSFLHVTLLE